MVVLTATLLASMCLCVGSNPEARSGLVSNRSVLMLRVKEVQVTMVTLQNTYLFST